jgi:hypothetical protein
MTEAKSMTKLVTGGHSVPEPVGGDAAATRPRTGSQPKITRTFAGRIIRLASIRPLV